MIALDIPQLIAVDDLAGRLTELLAMIRDGRVLTAFHRFYADDVRMQEDEGPPTVGFLPNLARLTASLARIRRWEGFDVLATSSDGDCTSYESVSAWIERGGRSIHRRQVSIARWHAGRIVEERFRSLRGEV